MNRQTRKNIEKAILIGLLGGAVVISPMGGKIVLALARYYFQKWWEKGGPYIPPEADPEQVRQTLYNLKRKKYVEWKYDRRKKAFVLKMTHKGKEAFNNTNLRDISIPIPRRWDGRWRFLLFDIPEKRRGLRNILRDKLKRIGFFQFQKSVWIYPFECEKEMQYICECFGARPYTVMFAAQIDNDRTLRRYFLRQGVLLRNHLNLFDKGVKY